MRSLFFSLLLLLLTACSGNSINPNCQFLLDVNVNYTLNLSFDPDLGYVGNSVYIPNQGNGGIIVTNAGSGFFAWDASDPNHALSSCSVLEISGLEATCGCSDQNTYSLVNGQPLGDSSLFCGLKNYRVEQNGNSLWISN